ncbi:alpha/beta-hydrolase [Myriangium duriaei CBS 260.36]|uniref:Palmitoyl-protein thioesterase 1 n=1 Tax=Myriangium duriaei CBS 260.36 TaxID=1168546 RepID=A0A9P4J8J3_9PEZI|nr:alpha/beta-hydrolase [Myriangium duriaei CBS 260.36]
MWSTALLTLPFLLPATLATPVPSSSPLPVIIWHGLGDHFDNQGLSDVADLIKEVHPGTHTHIIALADDGAGDQRASFFGNVTAQSDIVCEQLSADPLLSGKTGRIDALGFSQGGLFLRGLTERCPGISVRSLVTFGSPHNGIAELARCGTWDLLCKGAVGAVGANRWSEWVQSNVVPAQYFRERDEVTGLAGEDYLEYSGWLADVNNERSVKDGKYAERLARLDTFALYAFEKDTTLLPKETAWFADVNATTGAVTDLKDRLLYDQDWLGLKKLDQRGALVFRTVENARHMQLSDKLLRKAFVDFFGAERKSVDRSNFESIVPVTP